MTEYGGPVKLVHDGADRHGSVPAGEKCRCGWINFANQPPEYEAVLHAAQRISAGDDIWVIQMFRCEECSTLRYQLPEDHEHPMQSVLMLENQLLTLPASSS